jgi:hypothetical protein
MSELLIKNYIEQKNGSFSFEGLSIPADTANRHYSAMLREVADGNATIEYYAGSAREAADALADLANTERSWRDAELAKTDIDIYKLEDASSSATAYRAYRVALRDYPQQPDFPNGTRPTSP